MLSQKDKHLLSTMFSMEDKTLYKFLYMCLKKHYKEEDIILNADYIIAKGTLPVGLLAHMDTVFAKKTSSKSVYYDSEKGVMWSPDGLGADDRAGIFIILKLLASLKQKPTIIFTLGEEKGGIGASVVIKDYPTNFLNLRFLIELDRQGKEDSVYYDCGNGDFEEYINKFGFVTDWGTFTDISVIAPVWDIAAVNLSVGYFSEHTKTETLIIPYLFATMEKVKKILNNLPDENIMFPHMTKKWYETYSYAFETKDFNVICKTCNKVAPADLTIPYITKEGHYAYICPDCFEKFYSEFNWCGFCGEAFEPSASEDVFCPNCKKKIIVKESD